MMEQENGVGHFLCMVAVVKSGQPNLPGDEVVVVTAKRSGGHREEIGGERNSKAVSIA